MGKDIHWQHMTYKPNKLCQSDLVLVCNQRSSDDRCMENYKSGCVTVLIYATLTETQTETLLLTGYVLLAQPAELKTLENLLSHFDRQTKW